MQETKKYKGQWHLVKVDYWGKKYMDKVGIEGVLEFNPIEGSTLTLTHHQAINPELEEDVEVFLGNTTLGPITLYICVSTGHSIGRGPEYYYDVQYLIEGGFLFDPATVLFSKLSAELNNLNEWVSKSGIKISRNDKNNVNIELENVSDIHFPIDNETDGSFRFYFDGPSRNYFQKDIRLDQRVQVIFKKSSAIPLAKILENLKVFEYFLMLCLNKPTSHTDIILYTNVDVFTLNSKRLHRVAFKLKTATPAGIKDFKTIISLRMLFTYEWFGSRFSDIIQKWFELYSRSGEAFYLIFQQYYHYQVFSENTFLNLAQAAESYHAKHNRVLRMPENVYNQIKSDLLGAFNLDKYPEHHKWLREQLNFGNEARLHDRLIHLLDRFKDTELLKFIGDTELFVKQIKWSRNYYTHYNNNLTNKALHGQDLYNLTQRLKVILIATILTDTGLDSAYVADRLAAFFRHFSSEREGGQSK